MASGISNPETAQPEFGIRNAKGEWRPPYPAKTAPLFCWPPRPIQSVKWLLSYPGYLMPWNSIYLLISIATWFYLQPALERCTHFHVGWISQMYFRNLALLWLLAGGWHLILYTLKLQGTERKYDPRWLRVGDRNFLFRNQLRDNIFWACTSGCAVWTAYEVFYMWAAANHRVPYLSWNRHPAYFVLGLAAVPFWREFHFYWTHRLIHWKLLYKHVHYLHHKNVNPGPWSGLAMHPVEHVIYFSVVLIHWVVPSHPLHFLFNSQLTALEPAGTHHGFEGPVLNGKVPTGSYSHYLHHRYFDCNFGGSKLPFDRIFGTFRDGLSDFTKSKPSTPSA